MIGRQDNENLYLIYSRDLHVWDGGVPILGSGLKWLPVLRVSFSRRAS